MATCRSLFPGRVHGRVVQPMSGKNRKAPRRRGMTSKCDEVNFDAICQAAHKRVVAVLRCLAVLVPDATPRQRKRLANRILSLCDGKERRVKITETTVRDMVLRNSQCLQRNCPMLLFTEPLAREWNAYFAEEDQ
jgi:hypothetical protein